MSARVLILTAGFGEGHNAAARALGEAFDAQHGAGSARVADCFALAAPRLNRLLRRGYLLLVNRTPRLWSAAYAWLDRSTAFPRLARLLREERRVLAHLIADEVPDAIVSTYPVYAFLLQQLGWDARARPPHFNVVTDSISINSLWWRAGADGWFVPNEDSAAVLRTAGIAEQRLHVLGFPVAAAFQHFAGELAPPNLAAGAAPRVLYIINSSTRTAAQTARRLLTETPWDVTCTVGRNEPLRRELEHLARQRPHRSTILGWTTEIPRLLHTHHVVISKAGGATTQEAIAAQCPMIVNQIVPGQEQGNWELLRRHGAGALATTPEAVLAELKRAFDGGGHGWQQWRRALRPLSRPAAAREIAACVSALAEVRYEPVPLPFRPVPAPA